MKLSIMESRVGSPEMYTSVCPYVCMYTLSTGTYVRTYVYVCECFACTYMYVSNLPGTSYV